MMAGNLICFCLPCIKIASAEHDLGEAILDHWVTSTIGMISLFDFLPCTSPSEMILFMWLFIDFIFRIFHKDREFTGLVYWQILSILSNEWNILFVKQIVSKKVSSGLMPSHSLLIDQNCLFPLDAQGRINYFNRKFYSQPLELYLFQPSYMVCLPTTKVTSKFIYQCQGH